MPDEDDDVHLPIFIAQLLLFVVVVLTVGCAAANTLDQESKLLSSVGDVPIFAPLAAAALFSNAGNAE